MVGGLSALAAFAIILVAYLLLFGTDTQGTPQTKKKNGPAKKSNAPELPSVPPPISKPKEKTKEEWEQEFEELRKIPDGEKERKLAALKVFFESCNDALLCARARTMFTKLGGRLEPPIKPDKTSLEKKAEGLKAEYFRGREFRQDRLITSQTDLMVSLNTKNPRPPGVPKSEFSARWQGYLYVKEEGYYTIATIADDGVRVRLNGRLIIDDWADHAPQRNEKKVTLEPGYHKLSIEYYQGAGDGEVSLRWSMEKGFGEQLITTDHLFHEGK